jgi:hypothetical protein
VDLLGLGLGLGLGCDVMAWAAAEARRQGLIGMWPDSWTMQGPGFHQKPGFGECGRVTGYLKRLGFIFYLIFYFFCLKRLAPGDDGAPGSLQ